ncbi:hypothetical protein CEXT_52391 [Caerostris extrusa]|uniref:Uncharacterized protein n=1 Tax=Caerostris extrusa TaxID=172846 RepID=A0AAV4RS67_CAEEX|nr:hypothetical protein CEXT_52391 [Caerostris extrusa]
MGTNFSENVLDCQTELISLIYESYQLAPNHFVKPSLKTHIYANVLQRTFIPHKQIVSQRAPPFPRRRKKKKKKNKRFHCQKNKYIKPNCSRSNAKGCLKVFP